MDNQNEERIALKAKIFELRAKEGLSFAAIQTQFKRKDRTLITRMIHAIDWWIRSEKVRTIRFYRTLGLTLQELQTLSGFGLKIIASYIEDLDATRNKRVADQIRRLRLAGLTIMEIRGRLHCSQRRVYQAIEDLPKLSADLERLQRYLLEHPMETPRRFAHLFPRWTERTFFYHVKKLTPLVHDDHYDHPLSQERYYAVDKLAQLSGRTVGGVEFFVCQRRVRFAVVRRVDKQRPVRYYSLNDFLEKL